MELKPYIGLEVHTQLKTRSKLFCKCKAEFGEEPNTNVCPICLGMPGVLPVLNEKAVELGIRVSLALNCDISYVSTFARKNYFYPDLPKGYQITQYTFPIGKNGFVDIGEKRIRIMRVHIEEESAKLIHTGDSSLIDFNRAGIPLLEIVTEPDIESGEEAVRYLRILQAILRFTGASDADMEKGMMRCEPNISVGTMKRMGTRTEIKNLNSFKAVQRGIDYEIKKQSEMINNGEKVEQVTLLYDEAKKKTGIMRKKETAADYRYFPEPDLPPLSLDKKYVVDIKNTQPELPFEKKKRYMEKFGVRKYEAEIIGFDLKLSQYFESAINIFSDGEMLSKWLVSELLSYGHYEKIPVEDFVSLLRMVQDGKITRLSAKDVLEEMYSTGKNPEELVKKMGIEVVSDEGKIAHFIKEIMEEHPNERDRFLKGEDRLLGFFVGQVMKKTRGNADPKIVNRLIRDYAERNKG